MRNLPYVAAFALLGTLALGACNNNASQQPAAAAEATRPSVSAVDDAVKECRAKHPQAAAPAAPATAASSGAPSLASPASAGAAEAAAPSSDDECNRASIAASVWQPYLQKVVTDNLGDVTSNPYMYFVPSSKYPENQGAIERVQDQVNTVVAATVLPGNMVAAGGPDSATTAQVLEGAFSQASAGSFKGVVVLFIGDQADEDAVKQAIEPSGATFKFAQM